MKKQFKQNFFQFCAVFLIAVLSGFCVMSLKTDARAAEERFVPKTAAVIVSRKIRPYLEAVEGLNAVLSGGSNIRTQVYHLDGYEGKSRTILQEKLEQNSYDLSIAVGPEAVRFVWQELQASGSIRLYCMVLNPEKIMGFSEMNNGVSLSIAAGIQLREVSRNLLPIKCLGLLFDPAHNIAFSREAVAAGAVFNLKVIPLEITSKKEIPIVLKKNWNRINGLWLIPDPTVISERIIEYIIKEAVFQKIPVIGYNRFFFETGAALSFVLNYQKIGEQTAALALRMLRGKRSERIVPSYEFRMNDKVIQAIGLDSNAGAEPLDQIKP